MTMKSVQSYSAGWVHLGHGPSKTINDINVEQRRLAQLDGRALQRHADSAHHGVVDSACPACLEIRSKMEVLK